MISSAATRARPGNGRACPCCSSSIHCCPIAATAAPRPSLATQPPAPQAPAPHGTAVAAPSPSHTLPLQEPP
ncbi:hypothetical protein F6X59_12385 [Pseudomonas sp. MN1F]|nr:hypothetical protein [Pseudomonas sp. MN1F]